MSTFEFNIDLDTATVSVILSALHNHAGELAAREMQRTGGRGFASGGISHQVAEAHRAHDLLTWRRLCTHEWRESPDGKLWRITGVDDLNYTLQEVVTGENKRTAKTPMPSAQIPKDWDQTRPWHDWVVVPIESKASAPPAGWKR